MVWVWVQIRRKMLGSAKSHPEQVCFVLLGFWVACSLCIGMFLNSQPRCWNWEHNQVSTSCRQELVGGGGQAWQRDGTTSWDCCISGELVNDGFFCFLGENFLHSQSASVPQFRPPQLAMPSWSMSGAICGHNGSISYCYQVQPVEMWSFGFSFIHLRYICPWIPLKWRVIIFLKSWTSTCYFSNLTSSSVTSGWFSLFIAAGLGCGVWIPFFSCIHKPMSASLVWIQWRFKSLELFCGLCAWF